MIKFLSLACALGVLATCGKPDCSNMQNNEIKRWEKCLETNMQELEKSRS